MRLWRTACTLGLGYAARSVLGDHIALVFTRVDGNMGYCLFTNLHVKNSHGIVAHWNLRPLGSLGSWTLSTGYRDPNRPSRDALRST